MKTPKVKSVIIEEIGGDDKNKGDLQEDGSYEFKGKIKKSSFMLTINSQRTVFTDEFKEKFVKFNKFMFEGNRILKYFKCKQCADGKCKGSKGVVGCLEDVDLINKIELGPRTMQLHSHTSIVVIHSGVVQVDIDKVKKIAYAYFGYKVYISIRGSPDVSFGRERYLSEKGQLTIEKK